MAIYTDGAAQRGVTGWPQATRRGSLAPSEQWNRIAAAPLGPTTPVQEVPGLLVLLYKEEQAISDPESRFF